MTTPRSATRARSNREPSRRNDPEGLRRKVLDAAFGMFQTHGYNGTSMQDLTKAIEVTGGALHHHFPTKRSLLSPCSPSASRPQFAKHG